MHEHVRPELRENWAIVEGELEKLDYIGKVLGFGRGDFWNLPELERKLKDIPWPQEYIDVTVAKVRKILAAIGEAAMQNDCSPYLAFEAYKSLGVSEKISDRIKKGHRTTRGAFDYDLLSAVLTYGSEAQAEEALKDYITETDAQWLDLLEDKTGYLQSRLNIIRTSYDQFASENGLKAFPQAGNRNAGFAL